MTVQSFTTSFFVDRTAKETFDAINDVRGWWTGAIEGSSKQLDDEFSYRYEDIHYSKQKLTEFVPNERVVWLVTESHLNFVADKAEWTGTSMTFDISESGDQTEVRFAHNGLVPDFECFDGCSGAWGFYINTSLKNFITTGVGDPK